MNPPHSQFRKRFVSPSFLANSLAIALCWQTAIQLHAQQFDTRSAAKHVVQIVAHRGASAQRPECTVSAIEQAIEAGATAVEVDVRTSQDGQLFILHDATLNRTTNGSGPANRLTLDQLQELDAGVWFNPDYRGLRIPSLIEATKACRDRIDLLLDLKEQGDDYDNKVAAVIKEHGDPAMTIVGVRDVEQAKRFRRLLPQSRQLALIPTVDSIEAFAGAGVDTIRLWPRWLSDGDDPVKRVRATGKRLHLNGTMGEIDETLSLLAFNPDSLLTDHPAQLKRTLQKIAGGEIPSQQLETIVESSGGTQLAVAETRVGSRTFLNRDYQMIQVPAELAEMPRYRFGGGDGNEVRIRFQHSAVVFAVFDYNDSGVWSFEDGRSPKDFGWHLWRPHAYQVPNAYRGSSNPEKAGKPNLSPIWFREFKPGQELFGLPAWWVCLGVVDLKTASDIKGFTAGLTSDVMPPAPRYSHANQAAKHRPLSVPIFETSDSFQQWQTRQRKRFVDAFLYRYDDATAIVAGPVTQHDTHRRQEFQVTLDGQRLFRFFRLSPRRDNSSKPLPTIVCFMGHGKVTQILDDQQSYQHACALNFAKAGYLVYAMENIGMEPGSDTHHDLDQSLRLEGHGWYSLLFAHQRILLDRVFSDPLVDTERVGVAGVSTGGLLSLSAAVIEPRVAAASVQGIFGSMRTSFIRDRNRHCNCGAIPGLLPEFDLPELALLVAPRPLHISNGKTDGFSPAEAKRCAELISPLYQRFGSAKPLVTVSPGGHEFALESAIDFFAESLGSNASGQ